MLGEDVTIEGILVRESGDDLVIQVSEDGILFLAKDAVRRITLQNDKTRAALRARWARETRDELKAERDAKAFEERQRAKGLILQDGEWITKDEFSRRLELERLALDREKVHAEAEASRRPIVVTIQQAPPPTVWTSVQPFAPASDFFKVSGAPRPRSVFAPWSAAVAYPGGLNVHFSSQFTNLKGLHAPWATDLALFSTPVSQR